MKPAKIFFGSNIKFLRERKKITQQEVADQFSVTRSKINALESGQTKAPQPEDLLHYSEFFRISIDSLLKIDLSKLGELRLRELESGHDVYIRGGNLRVLAISVDKSNKENIEYVPVKAKAGYAAGYNDPEYIASLPKFTFPNLPKGHTYRVFPTTGDSMLPIPEGSEIIASYVQDWSSLGPKSLGIVILKGQQDVVFKQASLLPDALLLESLNPIYAPYTVPLPDVLEIWKFQSYRSDQVPEPHTDLNSLSREIRELKELVLDSKN